MNLTQVSQLSQALKQNIRTVILGKDDIIEKIILSLFCAGHILLEDIPGTGKTTLAKALAKSLDCSFVRVQFTPDLLPSDLTGINFYDQKTGDFRLKKGAAFTNILLADEINRATPRTQSSLLECMEEGQISVDGTTYPLDSLFLVIATQNPIETQGTFPLPEAQLDRFLFKLSIGYPDLQSEKSMLTTYTVASPLSGLKAVASASDIIQAQQAVRTVTVADPVKQYLMEIITATRNHEKIRLGASPRGSLALLHAAQACAAISGRSYVLPDDIKKICPDVLSHRIIAKGYQVTQSSSSNFDLIQQILSQVPVPTENIDES